MRIVSDGRPRREPAPGIPPIGVYQLEKMGLVRCAAQPCGVWVDPVNVPYPRPSWWQESAPRLCQCHWREQRTAKAKAKAA